MLIAIDADGTLIKRKGIPRGKSIKGCKPVKDAKQAVKWLQEKHQVYVFTNRNADEVVEWLDKNGFKKLVVTDRKLPNTKTYIDDRAIRFENNWQSICKLLG